MSEDDDSTGAGTAGGAGALDDVDLAFARSQPRSPFAVLEECGVVPVVVVDDVERAVPLARALAAAGVAALEVDFRSPAARGAVERIAAEVPEVLVGAGGLLDAGAVLRAAAAGARWGASPGTSRAVLGEAAAVGLPHLPGAVTPTEVMACLEAGATRTGFLPASTSGGVAALEALLALFGAAAPGVMATGGVTGADAARYLELPGVFAVGGAWVAAPDDVAAGRWEAVGARAAALAPLRGGAAPGRR